MFWILKPIRMKHWSPKIFTYNRINSFSCDANNSNRFIKITSSNINNNIDMKLRNSLLNSPNILELSNSRAITWYSCGPTVYDVAHLGHARTYVCTDIIRRSLLYLGYEVNFAMGVTDIDDKIIQKAKLLINSCDQVDVSNKIQQSYLEIARKYEFEFFEDMRALNVLHPDAMLRVSEHIDDIIHYIEKIESNGYAYQIADGLYFDYEAFQKKYEYGKLGNIPPISSCTNDNVEVNVIGKLNKRNARDFVLWKTSKPDEPSWPSPWGEGRPGWHIECSAMTNSYFGSILDIHSGGIDLKFPHHTNEIAQCEAYSNNNKEWVKCFIHTGHLYIDNQKMSKSLKNFISLKDFLNNCESDDPATDLRLYFLQYKYNTSLHFSQDRILEASKIRKRLEDYLHCCYLLENMLLSSTFITRPCKPTKESLKLQSVFLECKMNIRNSLCDDFDIPKVLKIVLQLIQISSEYFDNITMNPMSLDQVKIQCIQQPVEVLIVISKYISDIISNVFGISFIKPIMIEDSIRSNENNNTHQDFLLKRLVDLRSSVRLICLNTLKAKKKSIDPSDCIIKDEMSKLLYTCDDIRHDINNKLNVRIEDS